MTARLTFVCYQCPPDEDIFYTSNLAEFTSHLEEQHRLFPIGTYHGFPLDDLRGAPRCRSCGDKIDPTLFDGYCSSCFLAKWWGVSLDKLTA